MMHRMMPPATTSHRKMFRLAIVQLCSTFDVDKNLILAKSSIEEASRNGASFVAFPEGLDYILSSNSKAKVNIQAVKEFSSSMSQFAKQHGMWLSYGYHEVPELDADADDDSQRKSYNSHAIVSSSGDIIANYRKLHLFDARVDSGFKESAKILPGSRLCVVRNTPFGNIGVSTCYDVRFPEMYVALGECDVLLVPSAFAMATGRAHWETLLRARAIEMQAYVVAAAQAGKHDEFRESYGHSLVVDPWGKVLYDAGPCESDSEKSRIGYVDIDLSYIDEVREKMPIANHRRSVEGVLRVQTASLDVVEYDHSKSEQDSVDSSDSKRMKKEE